ncbi:hypothetical protein Y032_0035g2995 [Ancylostoma ceylanicum]|uniref:Uncharacterized protein n=1 Tax=Ancylostoma ceylanicum TaxID=53326 RepID=A0A016UKC5_9BILA|nr:hypothetical protein Y032_0035g2995 [Ancylostoma ceylanicum]
MLSSRRLRPSSHFALFFHAFLRPHTALSVRVASSSSVRRHRRSVSETISSLVQMTAEYFEHYKCVSGVDEGELLLRFLWGSRSEFCLKEAQSLIVLDVHIEVDEFYLLMYWECHTECII